MEKCHSLIVPVTLAGKDTLWLQSGKQISNYKPVLKMAHCRLGLEPEKCYFYLWFHVIRCV